MAAERIDVLEWMRQCAPDEVLAAVAELIEIVADVLASHPEARTYPDGPCIERQTRRELSAALARVQGEGA